MKIDPDDFDASQFVACSSSDAAMLTKMRQRLNASRIFVITLSDRDWQARTSWIALNGLRFATYPYSSEQIDHLGQSIHGADLVFFSGNDVPRLRRIIREFHTHLGSAVRVCISSTMAPNLVPSLLNAGFDEVVNISVMQTGEFISRCSAMVARASAPAQSHKSVASIDERLNSVARVEQLNHRQILLLSNFIASPDSTLSASKIRAILRSRRGEISEAHMKILISQTRKFLRPGVSISSLSRLGLSERGYKLVQLRDLSEENAMLQTP